jgi:ATP adenylyltransferase
VSASGPGDLDRVGDIDVSGAVGVPDGLDRIWTPHRLAYIRGEAKPTGDPNDPAVCPFCRAPTLPDDESLIVARGVLTYAVLNLYPYNAGHLLVVPYRHVPDITDLDVDEAAEFMAFTQRSMTTIRAVSSAQGFNVGMNLGSVAGAGIAAHLHQHVVPRWGGDTNFMPIVGHTRVLPQLLHETRALFAAAWPQA